MLRRKSSFFSQLATADPDDSAKKAAASTKPPTVHIYVKTFNELVKVLTTSTNAKERAVSCKKIGHLIYNGGAVLDSHIHKDPTAVEAIINIINNEDVFLLRFVIHTLLPDYLKMY
jgi:hypothetical protein